MPSQIFRWPVPDLDWYRIRSEFLVTNASSYAVGDLVAQAGSQVRGNCLANLGTSTVALPLVITHGSAPGPVLAITAGIHGGEYVPMVAAREFVRDLDPALMRGTIVVCLQSSPVAFQQRVAFVNPLDGKNLNRSFPGDPSGGPTQRLAAWLWENLLARADYYIDCHCGDLPEALDPFTGVSPGPDGVVDERARAMADCFDVPRLIVDPLEGSTIRAAALAGIPAVLIEVGGEGRWSQQEADVQRHGLRRAAAQVGILPAEEGARPHLPLFEDAANVLSEHPGLWYPEVAPGALVTEGTRLGRLEDPLGDVVQEILAPTDGVLVFGLSSLAAVEGSLLALIARPLPTT
ncbi:MAG TPA: succinylglutamate desuccinylase/aspartoacylase family protein [Streptosporangiaceae bacterium]|nr:succinylglutamate desuccinylase/aspartoacylase family protein [Streptosporangiaceae bacterium]